MNRSENIGNLAKALAAAQSKFRPVTKDRLASIQSQKGSFKYQYADLATVVSAIKDALAANDLAILQPVHAEPGAVMVTTMLAHSSGEWISEVMSWPVASTDNRSIGSGITYARRHSLLAMVGGAATDEDDDAESARGGDHDTQRPALKPNHPPASERSFPPPKSEEPSTPGDLLWKRLVKARGPVPAHDEWRIAAKKALGSNPPPATDWTEEQAHKVELVLFPIEDRGPNP